VLRGERLDNGLLLVAETYVSKCNSSNSAYTTVIPFETLDDDLLDVHPVYIRARDVLPTVKSATRCAAAEEYNRRLMSRGIRYHELVNRSHPVRHCGQRDR